MQSLMVLSVRVLGHPNGEDRSVGSLRAIDHRRRGNPYLRCNLAAAVIVARRLSAAEDGCLPELSAAVCIKGINAVMFGGHVQHIAELAADNNVGQVEWLGVHFAVHSVEPDLAELS